MYKPCLHRKLFKSGRTLACRFLTVFILSLIMQAPAHSAPDRQSFAGGGIGFEVLSHQGSGTGFYLQLFGGYHVNSLFGFGLHAGYSNVGDVRIRVFDFGGFAQLLDDNSGLYGRLYLDGVNASVRGGGKRHGVDGTQTGFAPGLGAGILIPTAGDFHMVPELSYRVAILDSAVNLISGTFNLMWDF